MSEEIQRFRRRRQIEAAAIHLSTLAALSFSAWMLFQALSGLVQLVP